MALVHQQRAQEHLFQTGPLRRRRGTPAKRLPGSDPEPPVHHGKSRVATARLAARAMADAAAEKRAANKFSRQNAALGAETTKFLLREAKVHRRGLRGAGVETAKNCFLQGVGHLALYDPKPCAESDRGANFFIGAPDVGRPRDQVCAPSACRNSIPMLWSTWRRR